MEFYKGWNLVEAHVLCHLHTLNILISSSCLSWIAFGSLAGSIWLNAQVVRELLCLCGISYVLQNRTHRLLTLSYDTLEVFADNLHVLLLTALLQAKQRPPWSGGKRRVQLWPKQVIYSVWASIYLFIKEWSQPAYLIIWYDWVGEWT